MGGINTQHSYKQHVVKDKKSSSKELKKILLHIRTGEYNTQTRSKREIL